MIVNIDLADPIPASISDQVQRQIAFKLASVAASITAIQVAVSEKTSLTGDPNYQCAMQATLKSGGVEEAQASGPIDTCIADTAARLSRGISRKVMQKEARWKRSARG